MGSGTPVVPFFPFDFGVSLVKLNMRKKGVSVREHILARLSWITYGLQVEAEGNVLGLEEGMAMVFSRHARSSEYVSQESLNISCTS